MTFIKKLHQGGLWRKRASHLVILYGIGANLFVSNLERKLKATATETIQLAGSLAEPAFETAALVEDEVAPYLERIEASAWGRQLLEELGLPEVKAIQDSIDKLNRLHEILRFYGPLLKVASLILWISKWLYWLAVAFAVLWLCIDMFHGEARSFVIAAVVISIPWNLYCYTWLESSFDGLINGDVGLLQEITGWLEQLHIN